METLPYRFTGLGRAMAARASREALAARDGSGAGFYDLREAVTFVWRGRGREVVTDSRAFYDRLTAQIGAGDSLLALFIGRHALTEESVAAVVLAASGFGLSCFRRASRLGRDSWRTRYGVEEFFTRYLAVEYVPGEFAV